MLLNDHTEGSHMFRTLRFVTPFVMLAAILSVSGCHDASIPTDGAETASTDQWIESGTPVEGQFIVVLKEPAGLGKVESSAAATSLASAYNLDVFLIYDVALSGFAAKVPADKVEALSKDPQVDFVEQDRVISLPSVSLDLDALSKTDAQTIPWGITRVNGGATYTGNGVAWIIDTGVDFTHPDLTVDQSHSKNFVNTRKTANDDNGHGSHVAGIISAKNNTIGVIGVAAGATVVAVKVLNSAGSGTTSGVIAGVNYVAANGAGGDVANMSLGGGVSQSLDNAVLNASKVVKFCLAAGNEGTNANNSSPARVNGSNIYTISAFAQSGAFASWSNYGNPPVDYSEPGASIYSTYKGGKYATMSGTSMAAPHAAGILLLGNIKTGGTVKGDPDGNPDPIGVH
jgi:subtilisin family serine protease